MSVEQVAFEIWRASWQAAALVVLVLVVQWVCGHRLPPRWRYNLWLIVVLRLLLPVLPQSSFSLFNLVHRAPAMVSMPVPAAPDVKRSETPAPRAIAAAETTAPAAGTPTTSDAATSVIPEVANSVAIPQSQPKVAPGVSKQPRPSMRDWPWRFIGFATWLAGFVILGLRVGWITLWTFRKARQATPVADPTVLSLLTVCQAQMGVSRRLKVLETPMLQSPALFGLFRPVLLLPPGFTRKFSPAELRHVFLHELAHVVRRDLVWSWLLTLLQIVHWFNPAIWFGFSRMRADRELACDALALTRSGEGESKSYGATILKLLESMARPAGSTPFVGILESRNQMTRRIRMIASFRPGRRWSLLAILLMGALCVTGLTDAVRTSGAKETAPANSGVMSRIRVVSLATGMPLAGASVYSPYSENINYSEPPEAKLTDRDGWVEIPQSIFASGLGVFVSHPDYAPAALTSNWYRSAGAPPRPKIPLLEVATVSLRRGRTLGGVVQDSAGHPMAGVRVEMRGLFLPTRDSDETTPLQYPACHPFMIVTPVTDQNGVWNFQHFPDELGEVQIDYIRADGAATRFVTPFENARMPAAGEKLDMHEFRIGRIATTLPEGVPIHGQVKDADGNPLSGVMVTERDRRRPLVNFHVQTDAEGRFELLHRVPHQILLTMTAPGMAMSYEVVNVLPGMPELEVRMHPVAPLVLRVQDEAGKPLAAEVAPMDLSLGWRAQTDAEGRVTWDIAPRSSIHYQFQANGYRPKFLALSATGAEQVVKFVRSKPEDEDVDPFATKLAKETGPELAAFKGHLSLPDGKAAANATVSLYDPARHKNRWTAIEVFFEGQPRIDSHSGQTLMRTDAGGSLSLPALSAESELVVVHKGGYLMTTARELQQQPAMRLLPWGRIQGVLTLNGEPLAKQRISTQSKAGTYSPGVFVGSNTTTDAQGRFTVATLPAGAHYLYRTNPSDGEWPRSNPIVVDTKAGDLTEVTYEITGWPVVGRLRTNPPDLDFDWAKNKGSVLLKRQQVRPPQPLIDDFVRYADYRKATDQWAAGLSSGFLDSYGGVIEPDGSFRFDSVPAGDFALVIEAAQIEDRQRKALGELNHQVTIKAGPSTSVQDVGTIDFQFKGASLPVKPALEFEAVDLVGRPIRMGDFRGKYVLLHFWASWAPPSAEKLALLKSLAETAGSNSEFVILNLSLDDKGEEARTWAEAQGLPGLQGRLEGRARSTVTEALQVDELPTMLFVGPDSRLRARALPDAKWHNTVLKALNP